MKPKIKPLFASTYHRNGTVSYWNVLLNQWERRHARLIGPNELCTMSEQERERIKKHAAQHAA